MMSKRKGTPNGHKRLSAKQRRFIAEYLTDGNGTQAAIRANYAKRSAGSQAFDLLKKPEIQAAIQERLAKYEVTAERVIAELARLAFANLLDHEGAIAEGSLSELTRDQAAGLVEWHQDKNGGIHVKLDKVAALDRLGKYLKLFTERVEVSDDADLLAALQAGRARVAQAGSGSVTDYAGRRAAEPAV